MRAHVHVLCMCVSNKGSQACSVLVTVGGLDRRETAAKMRDLFTEEALENVKSVNVILLLWSSSLHVLNVSALHYQIVQ